MPSTVSVTALLLGGDIMAKATFKRKDLNEACL